MATLVRGRRRHLERQAHAVAQLDPAPAEYLVISMDEHPQPVAGGTIVRLPVEEHAPLPLAGARNLAVQMAGRSDLVVFIDVDCLPEAHLLASLGAALDATGGDGLLAGPVGRLPPLLDSREWPSREDREVSRRAALDGPRPVPPPGCLVRDERMYLFWSLSFAVTPLTHSRVGGFDDGYRGYGAEDTDYAMRAAANGVSLYWVGGAWTHHQHHPISSPPIEHLDDIVRNSRRFYRTWGKWPMIDWLERFAADGHIEWSPVSSTIAIAPRGHRRRARRSGCVGPQ